MTMVECSPLLTAPPSSLIWRKVPQRGNQAASEQQPLCMLGREMGQWNLPLRLKMPASPEGSGTGLIVRVRRLAQSLRPALRAGLTIGTASRLPVMRPARVALGQGGPVASGWIDGEGFDDGGRKQWASAHRGYCAGPAEVYWGDDARGDQGSGRRRRVRRVGLRQGGGPGDGVAGTVRALPAGG